LREIRFVTFVTFVIFPPSLARTLASFGVVSP
jgi:hypothetical protein